MYELPGGCPDTHFGCPDTHFGCPDTQLHSSLGKRFPTRFRDAAVHLANKGKKVAAGTIRLFTLLFWVIAIPKVTPFLSRENVAERRTWQGTRGGRRRSCT